MKIAIATSNRRQVGGIETYVATVIPALAEQGHELRLWHDFDEPADREPIASDECIRTCSLADEATAIAELKRWQPDLIYCQGLAKPDTEARMLAVAPGVIFAHAYVGTCISGAKAFKRPEAEPCNRIFGPACLAQYFPRRCGGLSPVTMVRQYLLQSRRLEVLHQFQAIVVASGHMAEEYARHGLKEKTQAIPLPVPNPGAADDAFPAWPAGPCELLFLGRLELLKGGQHLLEALPQVQKLLGRNVHATFAGAGPAMAEWNARAQQVMQGSPGVVIRFVGWAGAQQRKELLRTSHLLVMPSVWPEPFGLAGVEAGFFGVPAAAFRAGGIADWLTDGINGHLAPANPPRPGELAQAIANCLRDEKTYGRLCLGAKSMARRFTLESHVRALTSVLEKAQAGT